MCGSRKVCFVMASLVGGGVLLVCQYQLLTACWRQAGMSSSLSQDVITDHYKSAKDKDGGGSSSHIRYTGDEEAKTIPGLSPKDKDGGGSSTRNRYTEEEEEKTIPGLIPPVVHYLWCGDKKFRFKDYLGVVSAIKMFQPLKLVFHYTHRPRTDDYNVWFKELQSTVPALEMRQLSPAPSCGSVDMLNAVLDLLAVDGGGIFVGENILLSFAVKRLPRNADLWFAFSNKTSDKTSGVIIAKRGFNESVKHAYLQKITAAAATHPGCASPDTFSLSVPGKDDFCVALPGTVYPRDIIDARTSFAELARFVFYGRREPMAPVQDTSNLIPRIAHFLRFKSGKSLYNDFAFGHFMSVLSALYMAGFERVYMHVEEEPTGRWWQELAKENVTLVKVVRTTSVFQQPINVIEHVSDIARSLILYKYGGAYQDFDVTWTSRVPDSLLSYPFVTGPDWVLREQWPDTLNLGVMLARPHAQWLHHFIQTHKDYRDRDFVFNSGQMSYRTYEIHPDLLYLDRKLHVICYLEICHPTWGESYLRGMNDRRPTLAFNWTDDVRALHVTGPKPHPSLASLEAVRKGKDRMAEIGRSILNKSGRRHLLS